MWPKDLLERSAHLISLAAERGVTLGTAESCTGGLVCGLLTAVPGSSACVRGGIVSYAIPVKEDVLNVPRSVTQDSSIGVVSSECASRMASGARKVLDCDFAVSTTGIAGPSGAEPGKPVGTVWLGVDAFGIGRTVECHFSGSRSDVRLQAVAKAIELLTDEVTRWS